MTLIAFRTAPDVAEIVTDTWTYNASGRHFANTTKVHPMVHANTVAIGRGNQGFTFHVHALLAPQSGFVRSLDDLRTKVDIPSACHSAHLMTEREQGGAPVGDCTLYLVGYSESRETFEAYEYETSNGYREVPVTGFHVTPSPWGIRPRQSELEHWVALMHDASRWGDNADAARAQCDADHEVLTSWPAQEAVAAPDTVESWALLAERVRQDRAAAHPSTGMKIPVGGDVHLTRLVKGAVSTATIWTFDDTREGLKDVMRGTLSGLGLSLPCPCDSGQAFLDCHIPAALTDACPCGSGSALAACCLAPVASDAT